MSGISPTYPKQMWIIFGVSLLSCWYLLSQACLPSIHDQTSTQTSESMIPITVLTTVYLNKTLTSCLDLSKGPTMSLKTPTTHKPWFWDGLYGPPRIAVMTASHLLFFFSIGSPFLLHYTNYFISPLSTSDSQDGASVCHPLPQTLTSGLLAPQIRGPELSQHSPTCISNSGLSLPRGRAYWS